MPSVRTSWAAKDYPLWCRQQPVTADGWPVALGQQRVMVRGDILAGQVFKNC